MTAQPLFPGIISGERRRGHAEVADRAARMAGGFEGLGVRQGDSVCILMRNDIAFIEAAYGAMQLGAYAVPVNWHFKPEEIHYILADSGTRVLVAHADMLHQLRGAIPKGITVLSVPTPPEILANYKIDPDHLATPDFAVDLESWLQAQRPYDGPARPQPANMIYTSGTTGHPKGVRRHAPTPEQSASAERMRADLRPEAAGARVVVGTALSFGSEFVRSARGPTRRCAGPDAAVRSGAILGPGSEREDRHHLHGADHVRPADEAAGKCAPEVRHLLAAPRRPCRGALPRRRQARDDRMVGAGDL
jgi:hypothetical protein